MNEYFICNTCNQKFHYSHLRTSETIEGYYCPTCVQEKCAACGEFFQHGFLSFKDDVKNYVCINCEHDYKDVSNFIQPLLKFKK